MKRAALSRAVKEELWKLFDAGRSTENITIDGHKLPPEAIAKQRLLWEARRARKST